MERLGRNLAIGIAIVIALFLVWKFVLGEAGLYPTYTAHLTVHRTWYCTVTNIQSISWSKGRSLYILGLPGTGGTYHVEGQWTGPAGSTSFDSRTINLRCVLGGETKEVKLYLAAKDGPGIYQYTFRVLTEDYNVKDEKSGSYTVVE